MEKMVDNFIINTNFSSLSSEDKHYFLLKLKNTLLTEREVIGINPFYTFGVELEFEGFSKEKYLIKFEKDFLKKYQDLNTWKLTYEGSLVPWAREGGTYGYEIVSPILTDSKDSWSNLKKCCEILKKEQLYASDRCGAHVHIGVNSLGENKLAWEQFLLLWSYYEDVIYHHGMGERSYIRKGAYDFAIPVNDEMYDMYNKLKKMPNENLLTEIKKLYESKGKYMGLNLLNIANKDKKETIEFRHSNGTLNPIIWQNNVSLFSNLLNTSVNKEIDQEKLSYDVKLNQKPKLIEEKLTSYQQPNIDKAIEFANLIFDNNLDKLYFLKQYLGGFNEHNQVSNVINFKPNKCKKLTF